ncbi:MAG: hypothetical protein FJ290_11215 [Planctomycetes bacterium]|nr:hypothetical protein [Planctomycetota bacterium]
MERKAAITVSLIAALGSAAGLAGEPPDAPATLDDAEPVLVAARLEGKRGAAGANPLAIAFDAPRGDGRGGAKGLLVCAGPEWAKLGTRWTLSYARGGSAFGLQIIHPFKNGQVITHVKKEGVGLSTSRAWAEAGYGGGDRTALQPAEAFKKHFPLEDDKAYRITSTLLPDGSYEMKVEDEVVVSAQVRGAKPLSFEIKDGQRFPGSSGWGKLAFEGEGFLREWRHGFCGVIIEPLDNGQNTVSPLGFTPSVRKPEPTDF